MLAGFGNHHQTEAISGTLPLTQNSPQSCRQGLYSEQISGSAFTKPRAQNLHSWFYRILPSVVHEDYKRYQNNLNLIPAENQPPNPLRWQPFIDKPADIDFVDSLFHLAGNSVANTYLYHCNQSMHSRYFSTYDGELLFVPYLGAVKLFTEFGELEIVPGTIAVIPRGVNFKVILKNDVAAGYLCENLKSPLTLPQLGPIGSNGLANPRHFLYPVASFEENIKEATLICKYQHKLWTAKSNHSPLNVVAWHGNYAPYSYDLSLFNTINSVSFDHPDPSIFTVLTSESNSPGVANLDFVIFPPRWLVSDHTFRPPYFHRNIMNELMGLVKGEYDAKKDGFLPGGASIHNCMTAHGPDKATYEHAIKENLKPKRYRNTLAFMFECRKPWLVGKDAMACKERDKSYSHCWQGFSPAF